MVQITLAALKVLGVFLDDPGKPRYGLELMRLTGMKSGSLYPILARLERFGWLESAREDIDPGVAGRPARRMYRITDDGLQGARIERAALYEHLRPSQGIIPGILRPKEHPA